MTNERQYLLSDVQYAFFIGRKDGVSCHVYLEITGKDLSVPQLIEAWKQLANRHMALRCQISDMGTVSISENIDVTKWIQILNLEDSDKELEKIRQERQSRLMNIANGELAGMVICKLPKNKYRILLDFDCVGYDITSFQILLRDFFRFYAKKPLNEIDESFNPYQDKKKLEVTKNQILEDKIYWEDKVSKMPAAPKFQTSHSLEDLEEIAYQFYGMYVEEKEFRALKEYALKKDCSIEEVLLAIFSKAVHEMTKQNRYLLNLPILSRSLYDETMQNIVGDFTELMIFEVDCENWEDFDKVLQKVKTDYRKDRMHRSFSGIKVQKLLSKTVPITFSPHLAIDLSDDDFVKNLGNITYLTTQTPKVTMDSQFYQIQGRLYMMLVTVKDLFEPGLEESLLKEMTKIIQNLITNKEEKPTFEVIYDYIRNSYTEVLELESNFDENLSFTQLGGDSVSFRRFQHLIFQKFKVRLSFRKLFQCKSVWELAKLIECEIH